ncbi:HEPN domain-containing protein [Clostridium tarantellae]|uniref:HEPN domain-containing protein n=1 Tax=Clostridium tarantellae TaxID=39493 RepID=A0A6I1MP40_9CLOT|nr:HEPN domain-containing protein [Clostridium tarantellae]MPQ44834.1 HEPN domain-containing protein [Clostridium tarantellae]
MVKRDMFYFADIDEKFIVATKNTEGLEDGTLVHCQQCIEKNLKGIIEKRYGVVSKEHNLVKLLEILYLSDYSELKKYKSLCRDLKDFYFSRRYASDDYEILSREEFEEYLEQFYGLLNELKKIKDSI